MVQKLFRHIVHGLQTGRHVEQIDEGTIAIDNAVIGERVGERVGPALIFGSGGFRWAIMLACESDTITR